MSKVLRVKICWEIQVLYGAGETDESYLALMWSSRTPNIDRVMSEKPLQESELI